jgi:hypothetical protein
MMKRVLWKLVMFVATSRQAAACLCCRFHLVNAMPELRTRFISRIQAH